MHLAVALSTMAWCVPTSRKMEAYVKRRCVITAAVLLQKTTKRLLLKERCFSRGWMQHEVCGIKNQLYEKRIEDN